MLGRCKLLGIFGAAALVAGMFLFIAGKDFSANWARWVFGPLLWFVGCALIICWAFSASYQAGKTEPGGAPDTPRGDKNHVARKAS
jgi:putative Mn2+ efflux pump MntP